jgi:hypothetical protein
MPGASREGHARCRQERAARLGSNAPARNLLSRASGARRREPSCGRSRLAGPRRGNTAVRPTQPAPVGAGEQRGESPTRVRGSNARRVCPRVVSGCRSRQAAPGSREACLPLAAGRVDGDLSPRRNPKGYVEGERGGERRDRGGQAATPGKSGAGRSRGRCGATELARWKASRIEPWPASVTRAGWGRSRRLSRVSSCASGEVPGEEATGMSEVRFARAEAGRERPPR